MLIADSQSNGIGVNAPGSVNNGKLIGVIACPRCNQRPDERGFSTPATTGDDDCPALPSHDTGVNEDPIACLLGDVKVEVQFQELQGLMEVGCASQSYSSRIHNVEPTDRPLSFPSNDERIQVIYHRCWCRFPSWRKQRIDQGKNVGARRANSNSNPIGPE